MSAPSPDLTGFADESLWRPTPALTRGLSFGASASLLAGGLLAAGPLIELFRGPPLFGVSAPLVCLGVAVQFVVLRTYWHLSGELGSDPLRRTGVGLLVSSWMVELLGLADERHLPGPAPTVLAVTAAVGLLALSAYVFYPSLRKEGWGILLGGLGGIAVLSRMGKQFDSFGAFLLFCAAALSVVLVALGFVSMRVWFGLGLIRLRDKLGLGGAAVGAAHLAGFALLLAFWGWLLGWDLGFRLIDAGADPQKVDSLLAPHFTRMKAAEAFAAVWGSGLTAALFLLARRRATAELPAGPRRPMPVPAARVPARVCEVCAATRYPRFDYCRACGRVHWGNLGTGLAFGVAALGFGVYAYFTMPDKIMQNVALGAVGLGAVGLLYFVFVWRKAARLRSQWLEDEV